MEINLLPETRLHSARRKLRTSAAVLFAVVSWSSALLLSGNVDVSPAVKIPAPVAIAPLPLLREQPAHSPWQSSGEAAAAPAHPDRQVAFLPLSGSQPEPQVLAAETSNPAGLSQEQAIELDKPGVVSIINSFAGQASVPDFDVDLKTFALTPRKDLPPHILKTDWTLLGSGFVVNPDGYIITNAHVISKNSIYEQMGQDVLSHMKDVYSAKQDQLSDKDFVAYQKYMDSTFGTDAGATQQVSDLINQSVDSYIKNNLTDNSSNNVVVVDKAMETRTLIPGEELAQIYQGGLPATVVDYDKAYADSKKDVALLKISQMDLPALPVGSSGGLTSGQKTLIFGYPSNARISDADYFEPTLTEGVVGAIKDEGGQKIIQLDNKISPGSSGGPLVDAHGNVVGITTYETSQADSSAGDNFGFALPVELAKDLMAKNNISNTLGVYGSNLMLGMSSQANSACKKALTYFNTAASSNSHFPVNEQVDPHIQACQDLIASSLSKDTLWDSFRIFYNQHQVNAIIFTLLISAALAFGVIMLWRLAKYLRRPEGGRPIIPSPPHPA